MKPAFLKPDGRRRVALSVLLSLLGLAAAPLAVSGAQATWLSTDYGSLFQNPPPLIDATNFVNHGTWNITVSPFPYRTSDTMNYTNTGSMTSWTGWGFDLGPASSGSSLTLRSTCANFVNENNGDIESMDYPVGISTSSGATLVSYLWVSATNIVNKGILAAGSSGNILLFGTNVDLHRSAVGIRSAASIPNYYGLPIIFNRTNLIPDTGFSYNYWAQTNMNLRSSNLWDSVTFNVPLFNANGVCLVNYTVSGYFDASPQFTFYTNREVGVLMHTNSSGIREATSLYTNIIHEAVFVIPPSQINNLTADARFTPSQNPSNYFDTVCVRLAQTVTNAITRAPQVNTFYLMDCLASTTNGGLFNVPTPVSAACSDPQHQPMNYLVSRADLWLGNYPTMGVGNNYEFQGGTPGITGLPPADFLYSIYWTNNMVAARYSALDTFVNNVTALPAAGGSVSHAGGRVQIHAGNLRLDQAQLGGEGWVEVQATHLVNSAGAVVDCQNLSFDVGSTNGNLLITNLVAGTVERFQGHIIAWSAMWSNLTYVVDMDNYAPSKSGGSNAPPTWYQSPTTNVVMVNVYVLVVDPTRLGLPVPVNVLDLHLHSATNIVLGDPVVVTNSLVIDGQSLTIQKNMQLANNLRAWVGTNAPRLRYFTNNGTLTVPDSAHFGDDRTNNYLSFVNNGSIYAGGLTIDSVDLQFNNGNNNSTFAWGYSDFKAVTQNGFLKGATIYSGGDIQFFAGSLQIRGSTFACNNALNFVVTNSLSDGGVGAGNTFACENGFNLWLKPATGDLLGTTIVDAALGDSEVEHHWAGTVAGGFTDNTAIGTLILYPVPPTLFEPLFSFYGTTGGNGLYVDQLDLSYLTDPDLTMEIYIDPSVTIYFNSANLNPVVDITGYSSEEEYLNNNPSLFGARLIWVGGPKPAKKESALSQRFHISASYNPAGGGFQLAANILPNQTNLIEATTNLVDWIPIYTNIGSFTNVGVSIITDPAASNYPNRFYRAVAP